MVIFLAIGIILAIIFIKKKQKTLESTHTQTPPPLQPAPTLPQGEGAVEQGTLPAPTPEVPPQQVQEPLPPAPNRVHFLTPTPVLFKLIK